MLNLDNSLKRRVLLLEHFIIFQVPRIGRPNGLSSFLSTSAVWLQSETSWFLSHVYSCVSRIRFNTLYDLFCWVVSSFYVLKCVLVAKSYFPCHVFDGLPFIRYPDNITSWVQMLYKFLHSHICPDSSLRWTFHLRTFVFKLSTPFILFCCRIFVKRTKLCFIGR